jgi:hypothetical protein
MGGLRYGVRFFVAAPFICAGGNGSLAIPVDKQGTFSLPIQYQPSRFIKQINEFLKNE